MDAESVLESQNFWHQVITKFWVEHSALYRMRGLRDEIGGPQVAEVRAFCVSPTDLANRRHQNLIVGSDLEADGSSSVARTCL